MFVTLVLVTLVCAAGTSSASGQLQVSNVHPAPGAAIAVTSTGWQPGGAVVVGLSGSDRSLGSAVADTTGAVRARVTIPRHVVVPRGVTPGVLSVTGTAWSGFPQQIVTVVAIRGVHTGSDLARPWALVIMLGALAGALVIASVIWAKPIARLAT